MYNYAIMYNYANIIDILQSGCQSENNILIQVRYCHLLGIWYVSIIHVIFFLPFLILHMIRYVDIYLKLFGCLVRTPTPFF